MADDASEPGDDGQRETPDSDVQESDTGVDRTAGARDAGDATDRLEDDGRVRSDDRLDRTDPPDEEYRVPLDLSGSSDEDESDGDDVGDADEDDPYTPEPSSTPIEPGEPNLENVLFVVLGAVAMVLVLFQLASVLL